MIKRVYRLNRTANGRVIVQPFDKILLDEHNKYRSQQNASDMQKLEWDQDLADGAQEYVESCECQALCEHGFAPDTSGRYGEKDWFHLGFRDDHRFGQNLFFSYLDEDKRTSEPVKNWQGEIVQYHYVSTERLNLIKLYLLPTQKQKVSIHPDSRVHANRVSYYQIFLFRLTLFKNW